MTEVKVAEYRVKVRAFLTKAESNPVPMRTMFGYITGETEKAYKFTLYGKPEPTRECLHCGRTLKNPVSLLYGIGPECGKNFYINPLGSESELANAIEAIKEKLSNVIWSGWLPKGHIEVTETGNRVSPIDAVENSENEQTTDRLFPELSESQENEIRKAIMKGKNNPSLFRITEIWSVQRGNSKDIKLVLSKPTGEVRHIRIKENGLSEKTGKPYSPKYGLYRKITDEMYNNTGKQEKADEPTAEVPKSVTKPNIELDEELIDELVEQLNCLLKK